MMQRQLDLVILGVPEVQKIIQIIIIYENSRKKKLKVLHNKLTTVSKIFV